MLDPRGLALPLSRRGICGDSLPRRGNQQDHRQSEPVDCCEAGRAGGRDASGPLKQAGLTSRRDTVELC